MRMTAALAKYWDSFENASDSEIGPDEEHQMQKNVPDKAQREWLSQLSMAVEPECLSILYAKSLFDDDTHTQSVQTVSINSPQKPQRISVGMRSPNISQSLCNLNQPPPKPQRCIARLTSSRNNIAMTAATPVQPSEPNVSFSTQDFVEMCRDSQSTGLADHDSGKEFSHHSLCHHEDSPVTSQSTQSLRYSNTKTWTPPGYRHSRIVAASEVNLSKPSKPPSYDQLRIKVERNGSRVVGTRKPPLHALRHTIAVNQEDVGMAQNSVHSTRHSADASAPELVSPTSVETVSTESVDSGQCSASAGDHHAASSQQSFVSHRHEERDGYPPAKEIYKEAKDLYKEEIEQETFSECSSAFGTYQKQCLPGYARMASTMDHVLRTSSAIYSLLSAPLAPSTSRDLLAKAAVFIQIVEGSPCSSFLPKYDVNIVRLQIQDIQRDAQDGPPVISNYFTIVLRKMVEQVLTLFAKIISRYLGECVNKDRLLVIALEHLIHLVLFGDELCLETIQCGGLNSLVKFLRMPSTPSETSRLLLRALAVLCGISKGCLQLLSLGGLDVVLSHLCADDPPCSIEAAGVLTQLTNPQHSFVQLNNLEEIVVRILDVIDMCDSAESLLLCTAAVANCSLQDSQAIEMFYRHNAVGRLISAYNKHNCSTIFVQEQLVTILSRMAARHYEEALIAQGAVPVLLEMLTVTDTVHSDYCRRIRYKAAVCIGTLAATGVGLKALYTNQAYAILCHVMEMENSSSNPLGMICSNIKTKLEKKFQVESAV